MTWLSKRLCAAQLPGSATVAHALACWCWLPHAAPAYRLHRSEANVPQLQQLVISSRREEAQLYANKGLDKFARAETKIGAVDLPNTQKDAEAGRYARVVSSVTCLRTTQTYLRGCSQHWQERQCSH